MDELELPDFPEIDPALMQECRDTRDFCPVLYECYQYVSVVCNFIARLQPDSPDMRPIPHLHYALLRGLLNRCSRLMLANVALSREGQFGETTSIVDRCIFETVVKLMWLCTRADENSFNALVLSGLRSDVKLKEFIVATIRERGGEPLEIEARMLLSIESILQTVPATEAEVNASGVPSLEVMLRDCGRDDLWYISGQRIGSHYVHGNWTAIFNQYLHEQGGVLVPLDSTPTDQVQYIWVMILVVGAMRSFVEFAVINHEGGRALLLFIDELKESLDVINVEMAGDDFNIIKGEL